MSLAVTAFNQIIIMFLIIVVGILCYKVKLIDQNMNKKLSELVLLLINPLVIFLAYQREFDTSLLSGLLVSIILAFATHLLSIFLSKIVIRSKKNKEDLAIERFAIIYSNCGFMGIPLVNGIFQSEGVFYLTAYITVFNLVIWTHGLITMSGKNDKKSVIKAMLSPAILATVIGFIFFISKIMLPDIVNKTFTYIADMNTPMAMLVAGVTIAQTNIIKLFTKIRIYYIALFKLIIIPMVMLFLFSLLPIPRTVLLTSILACACPTAVTVNLFSIRYNKNYLYASEIFALTTILSLFSIPIVMILANLI